MSTDKDRPSIEKEKTKRRIAELFLDPVRGNFDIDHLKEINRRIFQDLPKMGFSDVTPGIFRKPVPKGLDWVKRRQLESARISTFVAYSPMDKNAENELADILKAANPDKLSKFDPMIFSNAIANIYSLADYIHPFADGNSRTLREFTRELAEKCDYEIEWEQFNKQESGRDILYIARDLNVNSIALPRIKSLNARRDIVYTLDILEGNRDLQSLLPDVVKRIRYKSVGHSRDGGFGL
ncbi:MAG: Fic family protein [Helicobacteraceae bacterium]|jgi:cell filamentation protein|nr:Fic family protein [Helicobacteraceae bacterium]